MNVLAGFRETVAQDPERPSRRRSGEALIKDQGWLRAGSAAYIGHGLTIVWRGSREANRPLKWSFRSHGSILSIGSTNSILSIGSAGSILSIGSVGSFASIGSIGSAMSVLSFLSFQSRLSALSAQSDLSMLSAQSQWSVRGYRHQGP